MYRFLITGHTSGIGKAIYERFGGIGLSKSCGFDIGSDSITPFIDDCDVFVNNAFSTKDPWAQTDLVYQGKDKRQIVIGSNTTDQTKNFPHPYQSAKIALENACNQLFYQGYDLTLLKPGYVDTPSVSSVKDRKMTTHNIIEVIEWVLLQEFRIKDITFTPR